MKKLFTSILAFMMALSVWAEAPQTISYQAVVRNNVGRLLRDKPVGVRITILAGSEDGQVVYSESRTTTTNNNGLVTFAIGDANAVSSYDLSKIAWAENTYYLRCEMDPDGGNSYTLSTTSQMHSVPYALYAKNIAPEALPTWAQSEEKPVYNYTEIVGAPNVPTKVSELQNDANYITLQQVPTVVVPTKVSELQNDANYLTEHQSLADYAKKSDLPTVPTKVSDLTNDAGYITESNVTTTLNTINVSELKNDANYITSADVPTKVSAFENDKNYLTEHQSLDEYAKKSDLPTVPTKVSELTNDAGYITESNVTTTLNTINVSELKNDANYITSADVPTKVSAFENDKNYLTEHQSLDEYAKKSDLPTVPTKVSDLTNDAGYITESNVTTTLNTINVSELKNDANYITSADVPTKVSAFENDKNYLTEHQSLDEYAKKSELPTVPTKVSDLTNDAGYITETNVTTTLNTINVSELKNDANYITSADVPTKVSAFENDKNYLTEHQSLEGYAKTTDIPSLEGYAKKNELPSTEGLLSAAEASATYQPKGDYLTAHQSLEAYAKKSDLPTVPTKLSDLTNDANYVTEGNINTVLNTTNVSELVNDANYITSADVPTKVSAFENDKNYLTEHQSLADYALKSEIPNLEGYAKSTDIPNLDGYAKTTDIPNLEGYAKKSELPAVPTKLTDLANDAGYITAAEVPSVSVPTKISAFENDENYAKMSDLPSTDGLLSATEAAATYQPKGDYLTAHQSLEGYALKSDIPSLDEYALKSELPSTEGLLSASDAAATYQVKGNYLTESGASKTYVKQTTLNNYALKSELPSTEGLLSAAEAATTYQPKGEYLTEHQSLDAYALKSEIPSTDGLLSETTAAATYQPKGEYLTEHQSLAEYAKKSELPTIPTKVSAFENDKNYLTEHQSLDEYAKKSELPSTEGLLSASDAAATYQPKGEYLTEHQSLDEYAKKSDLPTVPTNVGDFENNVGYITKAKFDGIVDSFNSVITKYTKQLDSIKNVMVSMASSGYTRSVAIDNGALPGLFSVSADKQVKFSMGNLQYQATTGTWRFAFNQYDYVGSPNSNIAEDYSGWIDLFGWGTSGWESGANAYQPYSKSTSSSDYYPGGKYTNSLVGDYAQADWGVYNAISNGGNEAGQWRVLTKDEWSYLYSGRTNAAKLRTRATVEGVAGYVFFPDNWVQPDGISVSLDASAFTTNNYSTIRWNVLEAQGAVFLLAAGARNGTAVNNVGAGGNYWSSTYGDSNSAYYFYFDSSNVRASSNYDYRYNGRSVRLVQDPAVAVVQYTIELNVNSSEGGEVSGAGTYNEGESVTITATPATSYVFKSWSDGNTEANRTITVNDNITLTATFEKQTVAVNGALPGLFSVSADKQVKFSMGNLQYQATTGTWRFAFNQYDYVGSPNSNIAKDYSGWIDLFGWGTSGWGSGANAYQPYSKSTSSSDYYPGGKYTNSLVGDYAQADWGVYNAISNGGNEAGQWRVLTKDEWSYLYSGRTNAAKLRTRATVKGVAGYVFFPDNWVRPDGISVSLDASSFTTNNYSTIRWNVLEAQGAVFLPAAGFRSGTTGNAVGAYGRYWSSTYGYSNGAYCFFFTSTDVDKSHFNLRCYGYSVRLVQE